MLRNAGDALDALVLGRHDARARVRMPVADAEDSKFHAPGNAGP
jgi:hypothetical protein